MERRLNNLAWLTLIVVVLFILWIKYQISTTGSGDIEEYGFRDWSDLHLQSKYD